MQDTAYYTPKSITLFFDGTWQNGHQKNPTNISYLFDCLADSGENGRKQTGLYFDGVGSAGSAFKRAIGGLSGLGIKSIVKAAYKTLAVNYRPGDQVNFIGFSRGSTIARLMCGMIDQVGLLDERACLNEEETDKLVDEAYRLYRSKKHDPEGEEIQSFKHQNCYSGLPSIANLVCFDTVG